MYLKPHLEAGTVKVARKNHRKKTIVFSQQGGVRLLSFFWREGRKKNILHRQKHTVGANPVYGFRQKRKKRIMVGS